MTTAPIQEPAEISPSQRPTKNIFEDPAIQEAAKNDPFTRFIVTNWKSVLLMLAAIGVAMVAYSSYTTTALNKQAAATAQLAGIQQSYKALIDSQDDLAKSQTELAATTDESKKGTLSSAIATKSKEIEESKSKLNLAIDSLATEQPFGTLAHLYRGLVAGRFQDFEAVAREMAAIPAWSSIDDQTSSSRFVAETAALGLVKSLAQSDGHRQQAKKQLQALAENGAYVAVEAVGALASLTTTAEEVASTKQLIDGVRTRFPAQEKYLEEVSESLSSQSTR